MLVLNSLPNVQMLNGRSTKDEEEEEEDDNGEGEGEENNEIDNKRNNNENDKINHIYKNEIGYRNNHLYPQMEEIEEDKNLENNYITEGNNNNNEINQNENNDNYIDKNNSYGEPNEKEKKITKNIPQMNSNIDHQLQPNILLDNQIVSNNQNKKIDLNTNINLDLNNNNIPGSNQKKEKERESFFENNNNNENNNEKKENYLIDLTNKELDLLKEEKYNEKSDFFSFMKEFCDLLNNNEENSDGLRLQNNYLNKLKSIEEKKSYIPNYYYFYLLFKKKIKVLQNMSSEILSYLINKFPEINKDNILERLNNELFNTVKDSKELISLLHSHIVEYVEKKNKDNNLNEIIKEKDNKISSLEQLRDKLLKNKEEEKATYEKRISNLEKENRIMTERILTKANNIINSTIMDTQTTISASEIGMPKLKNSFAINNMNNKNKKNNINNEIIPNNTNHNNLIRNKSPLKSTDNTNTFENNTITINYYLNTNSNDFNISKHQLISLKTLKDFINELYLSKSLYDMKCIQFKLPKETLEEHMYTFLNKKYGLKNLIIEWVRNVINGIKYYSKKDSFVLLFGKILKNEQEEDARFIIQKVSESIEELLLYYIKRQNPLKPINEIKNIFEHKKKSELFEEEWKGIIYSIYEKEEAGEIEKKLENFINKENEKKKIDLFNKYKNSRMNNKQNKYNNNYTGNNNNNLNTINTVNNNITSSNFVNQNISYMQTIGNTNNNKLSRMEKYNTLLFPEEKNILYNDFIKIVLDNHIRFRDKQLKNFIELFKSVDTNRDGIINEEEFTELVQRMKIFKEDEVQSKIFEYLEKIDPFDNQKFTFSECITFFSGQTINDVDINGNEKEITVLEKICFNENENKNDENIEDNNNNKEINDNDLNNNINIGNNVNVNDK